MQTFILSEGVLNDDELLIPEEGKIFSRNYIAIVKRYEFQSAWTNKLIVKRFRDKTRLKEFLDKFYPEFEYNEYVEF